MSAKRYIHSDVWIGLVLAVVSAGFYLYARNFPDMTGIFPEFVLAVLFIISVYTVITGILQTQKDRKVLAEGGTVEQPFKLSECKIPAIGYLLFLAYVLAIEPIGFFVSTTVFLLVYMWFLKVRKPAVLALVTIGVDGFLYLLFIVALNLMLPTGILV